MIKFLKVTNSNALFSWVFKVLTYEPSLVVIKITTGLSNKINRANCQCNHSSTTTTPIRVKIATTNLLMLIPRN